MTDTREPAADVVRIALIDDHILIRDGLAEIVRSFEQCKVVLLARHGIELIEKLQPDNLPQLAILDLNMPLLDGFETSRWLRENYPQIRILILSMHDSDIALIQLLQVGVRGFIRKDMHPRELKEAIQAVMESGYYYSSNRTGKTVIQFKKQEEPDYEAFGPALTDNELAFLKLAAADLTYKEIAQRLCISPRTVDNYRDSLFLKLGVNSRIGLAIYAIRGGLANLDCLSS